MSKRRRFHTDDNDAGEFPTLVFLKPEEAAQLLRLSLRTLERWRLEGVGPNHHRFGRRVVYARDDLLQWAEDQRRISTSDPGARST